MCIPERGNLANPEFRTGLDAVVGWEDGGWWAVSRFQCICKGLVWHIMYSVLYGCFPSRETDLKEIPTRSRGPRLWRNAEWFAMLSRSAVSSLKDYKSIRAPVDRFYGWLEYIRTKYIAGSLSNSLDWYIEILLWWFICCVSVGGFI